MSTKLPHEVAKTIKAIAYKVADDADYLAMSRTHSGIFLNQLVGREDIGGVVSQYVGKDQVRHYIKDAILNRYSKDKTEEAKPEKLAPIIKKVCGLDCEESHKENNLALYRVITESQEKEYVIVTEGTVVKWETALKKALLFIAGNPFYKEAKSVQILLVLFAQHKRIPPSDMNHLQKALRISKAKAYVFGEE